MRSVERSSVFFTIEQIVSLRDFSWEADLWSQLQQACRAGPGTWSPEGCSLAPSGPLARTDQSRHSDASRG
jgi:hypothetical protein